MNKNEQRNIGLQAKDLTANLRAMESPAHMITQEDEVQLKELQKQLQKILGASEQKIMKIVSINQNTPHGQY